MAPPRIHAPIRGLSLQLSRLSVVQEPKSIPTSFARSLSATRSSSAAITPTTVTSIPKPPPSITPFEAQTVLATIHSFPTLEPLRFESYPATHLGLPTRRDILHRAVVYEGDNTRLGTASTLWRSEVHGSARKIRPQKGSGKARLGDKKSPMLRGGGVAFGPKPRNFGTKLQKKVYDLAWRTALSYRFKKGELVIVDNALEIETPRPQTLESIFRANGWRRMIDGKERGNSLLITLSERPLLKKALSEMGTAGRVLQWEDVDVKDLLEKPRIVIEHKALNTILLNHSTDLTHSHSKPISPLGKPRGDPQSSPDQGPHTLLGWSQYKELITVSPEERTQLEPQLLEEVADVREKAAASTSGMAAMEILLSAHQLRAEAFLGRAAQVPPVEVSEEDWEANHEVGEAQLWNAAAEDEKAKMFDLKADIAELKGTEESEVEALRLNAENARNEAREWRGEPEYLDELEEEMSKQ
ncbi:ribosomal protein L4 [Amniculicola lignicola CBS 123094]|uniref:Large ribosomal subunit protein uL4m n=1 Tax=Amniculicola lignicola CBS 123094 TaxID=1392246 RepID=A0A6A5WH20_9PLEO|nr:ribosomal protein L4 [Amniculicola lignicola CBS 123094]